MLRPRKVVFGVIDMTDQLIHGKVTSVNGRLEFTVSFAYAENKYMDKRPLWDDMISRSVLLHNSSWIIIGDFNAIMDASERRGGNTKFHIFSSIHQG